MTLSITWRDPHSRVHFFSDSRVNLGNAASDFGIKVTRMPYNIYGPNEEGKEPPLLQCGDIAIAFAGYTILPLMMKETLAEILFRIQAVPGWSHYDMEALSKFIFHAFDTIARDVDVRTPTPADVGIVFGGWCEKARKHRIYQMESTKTALPSLSEVLLHPGEIVVMGSGKAEAERLLAGQQLSARAIIGALKAVIEDPAVTTVGGNIQYGDLDGIRFRPHGVLEVKDGNVHYWRGMLDLNSASFEDVTSLIPNIPYCPDSLVSPICCDLRQKRWMAARMSSADLVQRKGLGLALWASMKARMPASSWAVERWTPRRIWRSVRRAKKRST